VETLVGLNSHSRLLSLTENISLGWKGMVGGNTLAYFDTTNSGGIVVEHSPRNPNVKGSCPGT
jgi:hypothetical protein